MGEVGLRWVRVGGAASWAHRNRQGEARKTYEIAKNTDIGSVFRALVARASGSEQQRR